MYLKYFLKNSAPALHGVGLQVRPGGCVGSGGGGERTHELLRRGFPGVDLLRMLLLLLFAAAAAAVAVTAVV